MLHLNIVSPEKQLFDGEVTKVSVPGAKGPFTILPMHAPIVSSLVAGTISFHTSEEDEHLLDIAGGFMEMSEDRISVCVEQDI